MWSRAERLVGPRAPEAPAPLLLLRRDLLLLPHQARLDGDRDQQAGAEDLEEASTRPVVAEVELDLVHRLLVILADQRR